MEMDLLRLLAALAPDRIDEVLLGPLISQCANRSRQGIPKVMEPPEDRRSGLPAANLADSNGIHIVY